MVNIFKVYNPLNVLWLAILLFALRIGYLVQVPDKLEFVFVEPFARLLVPVAYEYAFSPVLNMFLAGVLVLGQAVLLNYLVNHHNLLGKPSFLPALMYVTLTALFAPFMVLSAPLICNFLLIWMLFKLLSFYKSEDAKSIAYDLGMIVALGSLIYFPFIYLFLAIWVALIIFKPFNWREWISGVLGYLTVFFFLAVFYYLNGRFAGFYEIWAPLGSKFPNRIHIEYLDYLVLIPVIVIIALYFVKLQQNFYKSYVHVRKSFQLLFIMFLIAGLSFYVRAEFNLNHFLLCAVPAAVFFSYYFINATTKWFYESLYLLLLISIIYFQFNTF
ncbi:beta-carotene 15,15'-monooxygenase [Mucilaginibacter sp. PAMC 26640]|nr:beta-carotene 15,15'-monooxygenase [Mucilaginibacter sp. PAMC 26640]